MKIKIEHIPNTYNYGSLMMAVNTIVKLNDNIENIEFYVDASSEEDLKRIKEETKLNNIYKISNNSTSGNKISRYIKKIQNEKKSYDSIIVLGGDDISEYYGKRLLLHELRRLYILRSMGIRIVLLGQTIGPFSGIRINIAKFVLNKMKIYTRDDNCLKYLQDIGIKSGVKGRDLAFLTLPNNCSNICNNYGLKENQYITIVPSGLYELYTKNYELYLEEQIKIIRNIFSNSKLKHKKVVLLAHVLKPEHVDDRKVISDIWKLLSEEEKEKVVLINKELLASEARGILSKGLFTITGRMHAAVSTFYERKPALSLSYSVKYAGVIGKGLNRSDLIIESSGNEKWLNNNVSNLVSEKINYILENYETLIKEIDLEVGQTNKIVEEELLDLVNYLK